MPRCRYLENTAVPTLVARGSRLAFHATMCRYMGDLEACGNRILIFSLRTRFHAVRVRLGHRGQASRILAAGQVTPRILTSPTLQRGRSVRANF